MPSGIIAISQLVLHKDLEICVRPFLIALPLQSTSLYYLSSLASRLSISASLWKYVYPDSELHTRCPCRGSGRQCIALASSSNGCNLTHRTITSRMYWVETWFIRHRCYKYNRWYACTGEETGLLFIRVRPMSESWQGALLT